MKLTSAKLKIIGFLSCSLISMSVMAQDILKDKKGNEIKIVVVSSSGSKIEYKSFFLQDGASLFIDKKDIVYIDHADGKREYFETAPPLAPPASANTASAIPSLSNRNDADLLKAINAINNQIIANQNNQEAQNKAIIELLTSINANLASIKNDKGRSLAAQPAVAKVPNDNYSYVPEPVHNQAKSVADGTDTPNPAYAEIPYQLKNGQLTFLERTEGNLDNKAKGLYGGTETYVSAFGVGSSIRFSSSTLPKIYIKFESQGDPSERLWLIKGVVTKDRRRFLCSSMSLTGASRDVSSSRIAIQFNPVGGNVYEIIIPPLLQGEYAFSAPVSGMSFLSALGGGNKNSSSKISCFGIN